MRIVDRDGRRRREGKDDNGQAVTLFLGWESKEAHIKFRDTKLFEENIGLLREKHGGVTMVSFLTWYLELLVLI